jgi:hypothetical protein
MTYFNNIARKISEVAWSQQNWTKFKNIVKTVLISARDKEEMKTVYTNDVIQD